MAKTSRILDLLLTKICADQLNKSCSFEHVLKQHPASIPTYLDMMVTEADTDHFVFNLEMFQHDKTEKANHLDKHQKLIHSGCSEMLLHPVMKLFTYLRWHPNKPWYYFNFSIFLAFLLLFTFHAKFCVDVFQCECDDLKGKSEFRDIGDLNCSELNSHYFNGYQYINPDDCKERLKTYYDITKYSTWIFLSFLSGLEIIQFFGKLLNKELLEYFSVQNTIEVFMLSSAQVFLILEQIGHGHSHKSMRQLLGWSIFLAWINLPNFLGRFDVFGKHVYRSWHVMKNVIMSVVVYLPYMMAFSMAFHCFLIFNEVFAGPVASLMKVLTMILGEYDFQDNFLYEKVKHSSGCIGSVQILFIVFVFFGSLIVMNLITAWVVNTQSNAEHSEVILAEQRIEQISGATHFNLKKIENPSKVCISPVADEDSIDWWSKVFLKISLFLYDDRNSKVCIIREHESTQSGVCKSTSKKLPTYHKTLNGITEKMMKEKQVKQSELIEMIKKVQIQTKKKREALLINEIKSEVKTCPNCLCAHCSKAKTR